MKYCSNCGQELNSNSDVCLNCGMFVRSENNVVKVNNAKSSGKTTLQTVAFIFMIISTVVTAFFIFPLIWMLPMTISYNNKLKRGDQVSIAFKICTLLFVNQISGILMLVDQDN